MATEQSSSESSTPQKRLRRAKHDPQFVFTATTSVVPPAEPLTPVVKKTKPKPASRNEDNSTGADLYEPGDIVWSKLGSFPWWPALIYGSDAESGAHSRTLNSNGKSKRQFFVYFYGKYLEYSWLFPRSLVKYEGLERFIETAEAAVQKAATKSEQVELANRYQLKVSMKKRPQWDEAIALADQALTMTKAERIQEFKDLLDDAQSKKQPKKSKTTKESDMPVANKRPARMSSASSSSFDLPDGSANHNNSTADSVSHQSGDAVQDDGASTDKPPMSAALRHRIQSCIPPLSNYELKQIAESLLHHPDASTLTFDEAQRVAVEKAIEIVNENYQYRMSSVSAEWFFDAILLRYPSVVFKHRSWFESVPLEAMPNETDVVALKRWQVALMIRAQKEFEQQQAPPTDHA